ncbi:MAG: SdrD B-like domain-containing protein, partial [Bacteroidota bacterium]
MQKSISFLLFLTFLLISLPTLKAQNSITGQLFVDLNGDGLDNDPPAAGNILENIEIQLLDANGVLVDFRFTDLAGGYLFQNLPAQTYQLHIPIPPAGHFLSPPGGDFVFDPIPRKTDFFPLLPIGPPLVFDGGIVPGNPIEIQGYVWQDVNNNGIQDIGELPFQDFELKLEAPGLLPEIIQTDVNGIYSFPYLPPGPDYDLRGLLPAEGGLFAPQDQGMNDNVDSDFDLTGLVIIPTNPYPGPVLDFDLGFKKSVKVKVTTILGGALRANGEMGTELFDNGLLPTGEPYTGLGYGVDNPGINLLPGNIPDAVDWITIELRDKNDSTVVVASKSAIVRKNGCVVDAETGNTLCFENMQNDSYFVAVRHRNHLDIMTQSPVFLDDQAFAIDFTDPNTPTVGLGDQEPLANGKLGLWGGDANGDNEIKYSGANRDPQAVLIIIGGGDPTLQTTPGYY